MLFSYFSPFISARLFYNVIPLTCYYWSLFSSGISNMGHQHCKQRHLESSLYYITLYYTWIAFRISLSQWSQGSIFPRLFWLLFDFHSVWIFTWEGTQIIFWVYILVFFVLHKISKGMVVKCYGRMIFF